MSNQFHTTEAGQGLGQQYFCLCIYVLMGGPTLWGISLLHTYNDFLWQTALLLWGWFTWTFIEYMIHRFWMHDDVHQEAFNHLHHHSHPTEIRVTNTQRSLLIAAWMVLLFITYKMQNYFTLVAGFYSGFTGYFFVHTFLHRKWFARLCPRLQRFHILHHCKFPNHCFGVTVYWWDYIFHTLPPKDAVPTDRIVRFYFGEKPLRKTLVCLVILTPVLFSCNHYYYGPNSNNVPLLKEKNEGRLNFHYFGADEVSGIEFQGAYAAGKHTAIMVNFLRATGGSDFLSFESAGPDAGGSATYVEAGAGYFSKVENSRWVFETYAGLGTGTINNLHSYNEQSRVGLTKLFIQPSIGWATRGFEVGWSCRFAYAHLNIRNNTVTGMYNPEDFYDLALIGNYPSAFLCEPGIVIRGGTKGFKLMATVNGSINLSHAWKQEGGSVGLGISVPFKIKPGK